MTKIKMVGTNSPMRAFYLPDDSNGRHSSLQWISQQANNAITSCKFACPPSLLCFSKSQQTTFTKRIVASSLHRPNLFNNNVKTTNQKHQLYPHPTYSTGRRLEPHNNSIIKGPTPCSVRLRSPLWPSHMSSSDFSPKFSIIIQKYAYGSVEFPPDFRIAKIARKSRYQNSS